MQRTPGVEEVRSAAVRFLLAAFTKLEGQRVIPPPRFHPYLRVGRDYYGPDLMSLVEFEGFETALSGAFPERFSHSVGDSDFEAPNSYMFSFLEACVARLSLGDEPLEATSATADACIDELMEALRTKEREVACCRLVSHVTTATGAQIEVGDLSVVPVTSTWDEVRALEGAIRGAASAFGRHPPIAFGPPEAVIVAESRGRDPFETAIQLSARINRFMLLLRLLYSGTVESFWEVRGEAGLVRSYDPDLTLLRSGGRSLIRRTTRLAAADSRPVAGLSGLLENLGTERTEMVVTSFDMAVMKFSESYLGTPWFDQLVDLSTALEAVLSGQDKQDVVLRLRTRAAALLAAPNDPAGAVFKDVGKLYELRSTLVHGGSLTLKAALKAIRRLSTYREGSQPAVEVALGVDRLRDLVRRAILARIALATKPEALWPIRGDTPVDAILSDDAERDHWRSAWRSRLESIGAASAADSPRAAVSSSSRDDR